MIQQLQSQPEWDICIIGGGATGLGAAVDAASRGFKTVLFEKYDFGKGTSSRSTKLVHGGVRYLQQGNIKLVMEALKERGLLLHNAPHLVHNQKFVVPNYKWWEKPFYGIGLKIYDWMAGSLGLGPSELLSKEEILALAPTLEPEDLMGGVVYHDGQFDDARLAIDLAKTAAYYNAVLLNYAAVNGLLKKDNKLIGVTVNDTISGHNYTIHAKVVINATGVFTDHIMQLDDAAHEPIITASQGIHIVVDKEFLPGDTAIMIPRTDDGRVLFAVPWHNKIVLGTTDTAIDTITEEPIAQKQEIDFILTHISRYLTKDPQYSDIRSIFAGLRPLIKANKKTTAALSREHLIDVAGSGLLTIAGGKWTTYRKMAEEVIDTAISKLNLPERKCITKELRIQGHDQPSPIVSIEGLTDEELAALIQQSVQQELCMTVEDFLSRRTRQLLLNAELAIQKAPQVATIMAQYLAKDESWKTEQINNFRQLAHHYTF
ncbi:MAG: glycerol-3-phosphate dehydrogenase/oxidase [Chitinophagales bacterium]|nr:glycerol-3-phosphate dehydrogenase/oxidase [Chitinophagales bacterium]